MLKKTKKTNKLENDYQYVLENLAKRSGSDKEVYYNHLSDAQK